MKVGRFNLTALHFVLQTAEYLFQSGYLLLQLFVFMIGGTCFFFFSLLR